jgi:hypothetical protein
MTTISLLFCALVPLWLIVHLKKQSQYAKLTAKGAEQAPQNAHIKGKTEKTREIV